MEAVLYTLCLFTFIIHQATACTQGDIDTCTSGTHYHGDFCKFYQETWECLDEVREDCTNDALLEQIVEMVNYRKHISTKCDGMPHNCVTDALHHCGREVPINVKHLINYTLTEKKKDCDEFKPNVAEARQCYKDIQTNCSSPAINSIVDNHVQLLEDILNICDDLD